MFCRYLTSFGQAGEPNEIPTAHKSSLTVTQRQQARQQTYSVIAVSHVLSGVAMKRISSACASVSLASRHSDLREKLNASKAFVNYWTTFNEESSIRQKYYRKCLYQFPQLLLTRPHRKISGIGGDKKVRAGGRKCFYFILFFIFLTVYVCTYIY